MAISASSDFWRRFIPIWSALLLAAAGITAAAYFDQSKSSQAIRRVGERQSVRLAVQGLETELANVRSDVLYLSEQSAVKRFLRLGSQSARGTLAEDFLAFARRKGSYDQIRLLDAGGNEVIRIDWNHGHPAIRSSDRLQNKARRYYVEETLALKAGEVYVSPFDLNREQGRVERPLKPTIRFSTPVFDDQGYIRGVVILNFLGERLLENLRAVAAAGPSDIWLLNDAGYWLYGPSPEDQWGFMFPERRQRTAAQRYPDAWGRILDSPTAGQWLANGDLFTYQRVSMRWSESAADVYQYRDRRWWVVTHLPAAIIAAQTAALRNTYWLVFATLAVLLTVVALVLARGSVHKRRAQETLRANEKRLRSLLEAAPDAVVITDQHGAIALLNAQAETLFGYRRDELLGRQVEVLVPERFRRRHLERSARYLEHPRTRSLGEEQDLWGLRKDGSEVPVAISLSPVYTGAGTMVFSAIRDVSEQRRAKQRIEGLNLVLSDRNAELEALNQELEAFSYSVSHDLRAPLRAIDGFSQALLEDYRGLLDEQGRDYLGRVRSGAQRMGRLIDGMLVLSRIARAEFQPQDVDLSAIAEQLVQELRAGEPERRVEVSIAPGLHAWGDPELLRALLGNLLGNAWKFTSRNEAARIDLGAEAGAHESVFYVRDNGAGFDMTYADKLFGPFQRLHDAREFPGVGIGLATVQRVASRHGGRVWAQSKAGEGATFYVALPYPKETRDEQ